MISCWEEKMFDAQDDAHLSDVLSYPVHLHVIHAARRRLASKREWKITRIEPKKKNIIDARPPAHFSGATCHTLPSCLCSTGSPQLPFLQNFFWLEKINSCNDKQLLERNRLFLVHEMNHTVFCLWPSELSLVLIEDFTDITDTRQDCIMFYSFCGNCM